MSNTEQPVSFKRPRVVPRSEADRVRIVPVGRRPVGLRDLYAQMLAASWQRVMLTIVLSYVSLNLLFAAGYMAIGHAIENARPASWTDAFFFSVQTFATIGYGRMLPVGFAANMLVTMEAVAGFIFFAVATGLIFSRFSRPTSRVLFSNVAVIGPYDGKPYMMFRLANERGNRIVDASMTMVMLRNEVTSEGHVMRRFHDMKLARSAAPLLQLTWTVQHPIDNDSPLKNMSLQDLKDCEAEIIASLTGLDETLSQTIHARFSYKHDEIVFNAMFEDVLLPGVNGTLEVHFHRFHDVRPNPPVPPRV